MPKVEKSADSNFEFNAAFAIVILILRICLQQWCSNIYYSTVKSPCPPENAAAVEPKSML